ncbi:hypothetical protein ACS0TY_025696 [Phlomoides rotata]
MEDKVSTRRAWGVWLCLTEMNKVKYTFKIYRNSINGSFLLNYMTGTTTRFANDMFEQKRAMIWENWLVGSTRRKACNMMHNGSRTYMQIMCHTREAVVRKQLFGKKRSTREGIPEEESDKFFGEQTGPSKSGQTGKRQSDCLGYRKGINQESGKRVITIWSDAEKIEMVDPFTKKRKMHSLQITGK